MFSWVSILVDSMLVQPSWSYNSAIERHAFWALGSPYMWEQLDTHLSGGGSAFVHVSSSAVPSWLASLSHHFEDLLGSGCLEWKNSVSVATDSGLGLPQLQHGPNFRIAHSDTGMVEVFGISILDYLLSCNGEASADGLTCSILSVFSHYTS